jgi:CBS domain-containing protein
MTTPVFACASTDNLATVANLMWEHDIGAVPIVGHDGVLRGIATDRDICMAAYTTGRPLTEIVVSEAMASEVRACHATDTLEAAERMMSGWQVRRLPIVDEAGRPIGMLSLNDLALHAASSQPADGATRHVVKTLADIGQHRPLPRQGGSGA